MMMTLTTDATHLRQTGLIDPSNLAMPITMIGAGGIGSWTALILTKMGVQNLTVIDFDKVEEINLGSQLYTLTSIGQTKVEALKELLLLLTGSFITTLPMTLGSTDRDKLDQAEIVISAVDNMATRLILFELLTSTNKLFIDGRMAGNVIQLFIVHMNNPEELAAYQQTLFSDEQAVHIPCSERAVVYNTSIIAGLIADLVARHANGKVLPSTIEVDLANFNLFKTIADE